MTLHFKTLLLPDAMGTSDFRSADKPGETGDSLGYGGNLSW